MTRRKPIPKQTETQLLLQSRRRCCLCFGLDRDLTQKKGQIAHLDHDPSNNHPDNLAYLCFDHHDQYDSRTRQSKGLTIDEVKRYRDLLYTELETGATSDLPPSTEITDTIQIGNPIIRLLRGARVRLSRVVQIGRPRIEITDQEPTSQ